MAMLSGRRALSLAAGAAAGIFAGGHYKDAVDGKAYTTTLLGAWDLSPDVKMFRMLLPNPKEMFFLPTPATVEVFMPNDGAGTTNVTRQYTPVNPNGTLGYFDIIVKRMPGGIFTDKFLWRLKEGDKVQCQLRALSMKYHAGIFDSVGLLCAGAGLTPMLQVARDILTNPFDSTKVYMLYCNRTEEDILMRDELDRLAKEFPDKFKVTHTLTSPSADWKGHSDGVNEAVEREAFPMNESKRNLILVCGPDGFCYHVAGRQMPKEMSAPGLKQQPARANLMRGKLDYSPGEVFIF